MILSMTGFSTRSVSIKLNGVDCPVVVELKTLNSRFFEATCKLPSSMSHHELDIINNLKNKLLRGRIYLTLRIQGDNGALEGVALSIPVAQSYVAAAASIKKEFNVAGELELNTLMSLPYLFSTEKDLLSKDDEKTIISCIEGAVEGLLVARASEGEKICTDLNAILDRCSGKIAQIKKLFEWQIEQHKEKIKQAIAADQAGNTEAKVLLEQLYAEINKMDIHEEVTRFTGHIAACKEMLSNAQPDKGRRLDFSFQELMREVNTIMAKSSHFDISGCSVDIKVEIEKAREQVQNVV